MQGYLGAVAGDANVGVLDVDSDDLPSVGGANADAESLAGDHDATVLGDLALDADRAWGPRGQRRVGDPGAAQPRAVFSGDGRWQGLGEDAVADDMGKVPVVTLPQASSAPILILRQANSASPSASTIRATSIFRVGYIGTFIPHRYDV